MRCEGRQKHTISITFAKIHQLLHEPVVFWPVLYESRLVEPGQQRLLIVKAGPCLLKQLRLDPPDTEMSALCNMAAWKGLISRINVSCWKSSSGISSMRQSSSLIRAMMNATVAFCTASSMQGLDNPTPERIVLSSCDYAASLTS